MFQRLLAIVAVITLLGFANRVQAQIPAQKAPGDNPAPWQKGVLPPGTNPWPVGAPGLVVRGMNPNPVMHGPTRGANVPGMNPNPILWGNFPAAPIVLFGGQGLGGGGQVVGGAGGAFGGGMPQPDPVPNFVAPRGFQDELQLDDKASPSLVDAEAFRQTKIGDFKAARDKWWKEIGAQRKSLVELADTLARSAPRQEKDRLLDAYYVPKTAELWKLANDQSPDRRSLNIEIRASANGIAAAINQEQQVVANDRIDVSTNLDMQRAMLDQALAQFYADENQYFSLIQKSRSW